jgi:hypothetical protein
MLPALPTGESLFLFTAAGAGSALINSILRAFLVC